MAIFDLTTGVCDGNSIAMPNNEVLSVRPQEINVVSWHGGGEEIFKLTPEGEIEAGGKIITNDDAAIVDCFVRWVNAMNVTLDGEPVTVNRKE